MAKGNLFLGTAARSVGDVVMYRREGSQVSRVRVRKIANPKTEAQCRQRAYMAPIPKFFSPLAVVLERSFEGLSKSKSYSKFLKVNADKARANDWLLPKGTGFFPLPYQLSQGTIPAISYSLAVGTGFFEVPIGTVGGEVTTVGQLSQAFINMGYKAGDIISIVIAAAQASAGGLTIERGFYPITVQFEVNTSDDTSLTSLNSLVVLSVSGTTNAKLSVSLDGTVVAGGAVIVARFENDKWRRSTQSLIVSDALTTAIATDAYKAAAIASYSNSVGEPNPMVYLDGDELDNA